MTSRRLYHHDRFYSLLCSCDHQPWEGVGGGIAKRCYLSETEPTDPIRMLTRQIQKFNGHRHIAIITIINIIIIIITSIISLALRSSNILASVRSIKHRTLELRTHHHHHPHHPHHHHHINVIIGITIIEHFTSVAAVKHRALHGISNAHISSICIIVVLVVVGVLHHASVGQCCRRLRRRCWSWC